MKRAPRLTRKERRLRSKLPAKWETAFSAVHEAAHAVVALAVGARIERVHLTPKPQLGLLYEGADAYQIAAVAHAGPTADYIVGLVPGQDEPDCLEWLRAAHAAPMARDLEVVMGCAYDALEIDPGPVTGETDGVAMHTPLAVGANDPTGAKVYAWTAALGQVAWHLVANNAGAIERVARALAEKPTGLTGEQVREIAGPLAVISRDRLHESIDTLALAALDSGSAAKSWAHSHKLATDFAREAVAP